MKIYTIQHTRTYIFVGFGYYSNIFSKRQKELRVDVKRDNNTTTVPIYKNKWQTKKAGLNINIFSTK